jgi:trehalose 6-phosphate synthase
MDQALQVNPYHVEALADTIYQALEMDEAEKKQRLEKIQKDLKEYDINWWRDYFLENWLSYYE